MKSEDVALYLQEHPEFFEAYAEMFAAINLPHPHGGRTISLSERQLLTLRERVKNLEQKLSHLLAHATENDALQTKLQQFNHMLLSHHNGEGFKEVVMRSLRDLFDIPYVTLQLWRELSPSAEMLTFAEQQQQALCLQHAVHDTAAWFGEGAAHLRSFAYLPLRGNNKETIGMMIFASADEQRFYPGMGTLFLQHIADSLSCALRNAD